MHDSSSNNTTAFDNLVQLVSRLFNGTRNLTEIERLVRLEINRTIKYNRTSNKTVYCGSFESIAERYAQSYHLYFSVTICMFGTMANILNIVVLTRKTMSAMPINRILTALAFADMLLMLEYIPYAYYYYLVLPMRKDYPYLGAVYMLFHSHYTQILHTISICLTLTLAIWRYLAIGYPNRSNNWLFRAKRRKQALRAYDTYFFAVLSDKEARPASRKAERRADRTTRMLVAVLFLFLLTEFPQGIFSFVIGLKGGELYQRCYQAYGEVLDLLALLNGAINFILYCYMNRMFRTTFGQLFRHRILGQVVTVAVASEVHTTPCSKCTTTNTEL